MNEISFEKHIILKNLFLGTSDSTLKAYQRYIQEFFDFYKINIYEILKKEYIITPEKIQDFITYLKEDRLSKYKDSNLSPSTINGIVHALKSLCKRLDILCSVYNPFDTMSALYIKTIEQVSYKRRIPLLLNEVNILLSHYIKRMGEKYSEKVKYTAMRMYMFIRLAWEKGLIISEILNLKNSDLLKDGNSYAITIMGKGNKRNNILIDSNLYQKLNLLKKSNKRYLFRTLEDKKLNPAIIQRELSRVGKRILNKNISPNLIRYSAAILLFQEYKNIVGVARFLRHKSINSTFRLLKNSIDIDFSKEDLKILKTI
jgi:integrase